VENLPPLGDLVRSHWRPRVLIGSCLLLVAATACAGGADSTSVAPAVQRKVVSVSASPGASPVIVSANSGARRDSSTATGLALVLPSDGKQIVVVDSTDGEGVWVRRQPAGDPLKVWPDGSPMLIVGEDKDTDGRTWRNVATLDGQTGWVAAQFVIPVDPGMMAAIAPSVSELLAAASGTPAGIPAGLQARVAVGDASPAPSQSAAQSGAPTAPATPKPQPSFVGQNVPTPTPKIQPGPLASGTSATASSSAANSAATPLPTSTRAPTATPIRAPSGATTIDVNDTIMSVAGVEKSTPSKLGNRPRAGMELLSIQVKVANDGDRPFARYRGAFRLALSDRSRLEPLAGGDSPLPYSAEIAPGDALEGALVFEVPTGTRIDALVWAPERDVAYSLSVPS
jgi:hypothetical protein